MNSRPAPLGGPILTRGMAPLALLIGLSAFLIGWRMVAGLGAATALNDGYPLGLWIAFDVVTGTALACGGFAMALLVYILNEGEYHPLVRPALLTSVLGYSLAGFSVVIDIGRWWNVWKVPIYFWHWNLNSTLLEVALCIMAYVVVAWIELSPAFFERFKDGEILLLRRLSRTALPMLEKASIWIIALGLLLPTMHQSTLGTLMLLAGSRLDPLWRAPLLPLMFLISCIAMGFAVVVFESAFSAMAFGRRPETKMLADLARVIIPVQLAFVTIRLGDLVWRGQIGRLLAFDTRSVFALLELVLFIAPVVLLSTASRRRDLGQLVRAAMLLMFAGAMFRFDTYLVAFNPGAHWSYFPSVPELLISVGLVAMEIFGYVVIVRTFPILSGTGFHGRPDVERQAA